MTKETAAQKIARLEAELASVKALTADAFIEKAVIFSKTAEDGSERLSLFLDGIYYQVWPTKNWQPGVKFPKYKVGNYTSNILKQQAKIAAKKDSK